MSRRTREIGIRIAIGAGPSDVMRLVMGKSLVLVGMGTVIGLAMGFAVEQLCNSMLFNTGGVDMVVYVVVVPSLFLVTAPAAYVPARRASRIAPTLALRYEECRRWGRRFFGAHRQSHLSAHSAWGNTPFSAQIPAGTVFRVIGELAQIWRSLLQSRWPVQHDNDGLGPPCRRCVD